MWLGPKAYSWAGPTNMGVTYLYHPGQADRWGDNIRWNKPFVAGRWHKIQMCYAMNTVGRANGRLSVWFDGQQVRRDTGVVYRKHANVHITHLDWSIFRGGGDLGWAGRTTNEIDMDSLIVYA